MPSNTPLTDAINALTRYANETTGASDTTLSDAVGTLVAGYGGGGGGGLAKITTLSPSAVRGIQLDIDLSWFDTYDYILIVPDLTFSANDWFYISTDSQTGGVYAQTMISTLGVNNSIFLRRAPDGKGQGAWFSNFVSGSTGGAPRGLFEIQNYIYFYMYSASRTMTGTIDVYGIKI